MKVLVTGCAGFIGFHVSKKLAAMGYEVFGIDNLNNYYDVKLKKFRLKLLKKFGNFNFTKMNLACTKKVNKWMDRNRPDVVIHLAAQAGVRYSLTNPHAYIDSNLTAFTNLIEASSIRVKQFIYASSSSVYGGNEKTPFSEEDRVDNPISLYAATKKANELIAHSYSHIYGLQTVGLRFFTVYGPMGRPDMMMWLFTDAILKGRRIDVFNHGQMLRDFTYINDIVDGITACISNKKLDRYNVFNLGNNKTEKLGHVINLLEESIGEKADKKYCSLQPGDVVKTCANIDLAREKLGYEPSTTVDEGVPQFVEWFKGYHKI